MSECIKLLLNCLDQIFKYLDQIINQYEIYFIIIGIIITGIVIIYIFKIGGKFSNTEKSTLFSTKEKTIEENIFYKDLKDVFIASIPFIIIMNYSGQLIHDNEYGNLIIMITSIISIIILMVTFIYSYNLLKKYKNTNGIKFIKIVFIITFILYYILGITISIKNINPEKNNNNNNNNNIIKNIKNNINTLLQNQKEIKEILNKINK